MNLYESPKEINKTKTFYWNSRFNFNYLLKLLLFYENCIKLPFYLTKSSVGY